MQATLDLDDGSTKITFTKHSGDEANLRQTGAFFNSLLGVQPGI